MSDPNLAQQMRAEWNERAVEDAYYYVAFGRKGQEDNEFFASAADVIHALEAELKRLPPADRRSRRALEIGCGPGRLMRPMSWNFGEIHGVDVSDEMIRLAVRKLKDVPNAFPRATDGTDLSCYADEFFDFVYSYAVFQHIPSAEVVFKYLAEAWRVLKPRGILRCQINSLPKTAKRYTTWEGVRISAAEVAEFACANDFQLFALEGLGTQYMWITMRKQPKGWFSALAENPHPSSARIRNIVNAHSGEPIVPVRGRFACMGIWIEDLPDDCDLNQINVEVEGEQAAPIYIGPSVFPGLWQLNALMPAKVRTGLVPVKIQWFGEPLCESAWMRVAPAGPAVPRLTSLSDGVNLLSGTRISSRTVKLFLEELATPERLEVRVDGAVMTDLDVFCKDPVNERFEVTFTLPDSVRAGAHRVELRLGSRLFPPAAFDVAG
jgi:ubiquinone/menaquinone biosynthesis C-methylase UbiE